MRINSRIAPTPTSRVAGDELTSKITEVSGYHGSPGRTTNVIARKTVVPVKPKAHHLVRCSQPANARQLLVDLELNG
jgi:hypothetical protein